MSEQPVDTQPITPEELVAVARALRQRIPDYVLLPVPDANAVRTVANLHPQFTTAAINAVGASDIITTAVGMTAEEMTQLSAEADRWSAAVVELQGLTKGVADTNLKRRHRVGLAALQSYSITRQLVRHADHAVLLPHLEDMKRNSRLGRRRRKTTTPQQPTAPSTETTETNVK